jgi:MFS transporter, NNP family, nitrate/nitrite transporter
METVATGKSHRMLALNTLAFTVCFAAWMLNGVLITFLSSNQVFDWGPVELGWLMGIPVLTGSVFRLPAGILTDKFGGRPVFTGLLLIAAVPMFLLRYANSFLTFALCGFGFGLTGVSFAIGIAFTSVWYPKKNQGTALGIFGAGNAGAAITTLVAPTLLNRFTDNGANPEGWRQLPVIYAAILAAMAVVFFLGTENKKPSSASRTLPQMLAPLRKMRVWRFGLYYFLVFGCFVAFSQWLVPYFVNVYRLDLVSAGIFAALFSFPSGVIRALGGYMSDKVGARRVMYWVLGLSVAISFMLVIPQMSVFSTGRGVMAKGDGVVTAVGDSSIKVGERDYSFSKKGPNVDRSYDDGVLVLPTKEVWHEPLVEVGDQVKKKQLLARGVTRIFFQANVWIFAVLSIFLGSVWGVGKAAVYKHIPDYFPDEVGVVGGMVGVLGGLGGFVCPIIFGYLLEATGLWTSCWMFMLLVSLLCLLWMHRVVQRMAAERDPELIKHFETEASDADLAPADA